MPEVAIGISIACELVAAPAVVAELKLDSRKTSYRRKAQRTAELCAYIFRSGSGSSIPGKDVEHVRDKEKGCEGPEDLFTWRCSLMTIASYRSPQRKC